MLVNPECSPIKAFEDKIYRESRCEQIAITFTSLRPEGMEAHIAGGGSTGCNTNNIKALKG